VPVAQTLALAKEDRIQGFKQRWGWMVRIFAMNDSHTKESFC
jgi:hypothetical protein